MDLRLVPLLLTCGPAVVSTLACVRLGKEFRGGQVQRTALWAVGGIWLIAAYAAFTFLRYTLHPPPNLPPWKDSETVDLFFLFLIAPVGCVFAAIAGKRGASRRVVAPLVVAMLVLFAVGVMEGISV